MKPLQHHLRRLAARLLEAETVTSREDAGRVLRKVAKHQGKIERLHQRLDPLEQALKE
jgi:hypothetical protein